MKIFRSDTGRVLVEEKIPAGLSREEVAEQVAAGNVNTVKEKTGKSYGRIIADNLFTYFNLIWLLITSVMLAVESYSNLTFLLIVIPNLLIAIILEIRAKLTVEKLSVTTETRASVMRDGRLVEIDVSDIVIGDILKIDIGKQVLSDAIVVSGVAEANESMLTGEADAIKKTAGDTVLAGSFLVSGSLYAKVVRVGENNYVHKIERAAKGHKAPSSNLFADLNRLIKYIGMLLLPMAVALALTNWVAYGSDIKLIAEKTCGALTSMIPAGIYLLVTITLTLSVISLSRKNTLVQDMYSIEMLASADVVCLDKTGTITDGTMQVVAAVSLDGTPDSQIRDIMARIEGAENSINNTSRALIDYFGTRRSHPISRVPFSSSRKYSAVDFGSLGVYAIGAPHFVPCPVSDVLEAKIQAHAERGERVLLLARLESIKGFGEAVALIAISDRIRPSAEETIKSFQEQGVAVKIISGDHAATVSSIARRVGVANAEKYLSCEGLSDSELAAAAEEYAVFGRVTPEQKVLLIKTLKERGHIVAMTGDGVNDTLALKESNCAIAMAEGSEVARGVSQIVLLDSNFASLPDVVREGRRCINNVRGSASLYLMKTIFTICLSVYSVFTVSGYPFETKQFMLLELFVIGIASTLLAIEPNNKRIEGSFLKHVLVKSAPKAMVMFLPVFVIMLFGLFNLGVGVQCRNSVAMIVVTVVGYINLLTICRPFTRWRRWLCGFILVALLGVSGASIFLLGDPFGLLYAAENIRFFLGMLGIGVSLAFLMQLFTPNLEQLADRLFERIGAKLTENKEKRS